MQLIADFIAYSDNLGNGERAKSVTISGGVAVTSHFYCKVDPIEAKKVSL